MDALVKVPYDATARLMVASLERNLLPDAVIRRLTRLLLSSRLRSGYQPSSDLQLSHLLHFAHCKKLSFYSLSKCIYLVISVVICCLFTDASKTLEDAEKAMLELYCERAQIKDGHSVLDVGCGWGSLSLYIAQKYSNCKVTGICNSTTQRAYIEEQSRDLQLQNLEVIVADIGTFDMDASHDRIFSIEMFEHMKNYKDLLKKISKWMKPDSLLFVHHFCHKAFAYHFEDVNEDDWITRYFFTGGTMPSANLLLYFQDDVSVVNHWLMNGKHYAKTSEEWLKRMDKNLSSIKPIMESTYGKDSAVKWTVYWRTFFMAVAELFGYNNGDEWMVALFLFKKK
ncbi:hypothetical protein HYC85_021620 [Camellia sinensis]|uniref:(S)-coclaurine N-methyltransferase n=1 Tax=Camellia sinensis TaxID=4442 RepID=A0A7J7GI57_CAMSI|nr:hypothetical protein HYC85_021620 [Camellia sinensis]